MFYLICFQGPLTVCVQELDGSFNHTVQIEDVYSRHELPCHSKSRRLVIKNQSKYRKITRKVGFLYKKTAN